MVHWRCGGSLEMVCLIRDVVSYWNWCCTLEMWWLIGNGQMVRFIGDVVAQWKWCGSLDMWWFIGNGVVNWRCGVPKSHRIYLKVEI